MPGDINFKITGAREMEKLLLQLGPRVANKVGQKAVNAGARVIAKEAKNLVPVRTGALRKGITVIVGKARKMSERVAIVTVKGTAGWRAHLTEYGADGSPKKPFLRPALDKRAGEALNKMGEVLAEGIEREAAAMAKPSK